MKEIAIWLHIFLVRAYNHARRWYPHVDSKTYAKRYRNAQFIIEDGKLEITLDERFNP